jgi:hypothetical protein
MSNLTTPTAPQQSKRSSWGSFAAGCQKCFGSCGYVSFSRLSLTDVAVLDPPRPPVVDPLGPRELKSGPHRVHAVSLLSCSHAADQLKCLRRESQEAHSNSPLPPPSPCPKRPPFAPECRVQRKEQKRLRGPTKVPYKVHFASLPCPRSLAGPLPPALPMQALLASFDRTVWRSRIRGGDPTSSKLLDKFDAI